MAKPMILVNVKNHPEATKERTLRLAGIMDGLQMVFDKVQFVIAPQTPALGLIASRCSIPVYAQGITGTKAGCTTGAIVPETLKEFGVSGVILNHSELRLHPNRVPSYVRTVNGLGLVSILCVTGMWQAQIMPNLSPTYVAAEPPECIGTLQSISHARPDLIRDVLAELARMDPRPELMIGAGMNDASDVSDGYALGGRGGILVSSGVVKAQDQEAKLAELAAALTEAQRMRPIRISGRS